MLLLLNTDIDTIAAWARQTYRHTPHNSIDRALQSVARVIFYMVTHMGLVFRWSTKPHPRGRGPSALQLLGVLHLCLYSLT